MANKSVGLLTIAFGADLRGFDKAMKKAQRSIKKFGSSMKRTGQNLTRNVTLPIIGLGAVAVKTFATFEQSMLKVKAVSGATSNEFKILQNSARELGSSTMFTASQVADLQFELAKLGFDPSEIDKAQASILSLSQATTHDLAESGEIVAATLNSFNMEASESARVADVFALASSNAAIDMEKLAASMPKVGAIAGALNMDVEKLTAQMMTLADRGMEASTMGTSLRKIFIDLSAKGISLEDALDAINTAIDPVTQATELFGNRAAAAAVILAQNTQATSEYETELRKAGGTAFKMAKIMDSGLSGAMRRLKSQAEGIAIELGEILLPIVIEMGNKIKDIATSFTNLDDDTKKVIVTIGILAGAIGPLLLVVGQLTIAFAALFTPGGAILVGIMAVAAGFVFISENFEAMKERLSDWSWWKNSLITAAKQAVLIFGGPMSSALGITQAVLKIKQDTGEYEHEFGTFAEAIKAKAEDLSDVLLNLGKSFGLGGGGGNVSSKTDTSPSVQSPSEQLGIEGDELNLDMGSPDWLFEFGEGFDFVNEKIEKTKNLMETLSEVFGLNKVVLLEYAQELGNTLKQGANSFEGYAKMAKNAIRETISGLIAQGVATAVTSALSNPAIKINPLLIPVIAGLASGLAKTAFNSLVPAFAQGGLVTGPTMALVGEGAGTSASNPEVVAPLDKLKGMINNSGGGGKVEVFGRISGSDIFISNQRGSINRQRSV